MLYLLGLACAPLAVLLVAAGSRRAGLAGFAAIMIALTAAVLVFYTAVVDPEILWYRRIACCEIALASLLPLFAMATSKRRYRGMPFLAVPVVLLLATLVLSITDATGFTEYGTGWLPGIGIVVTRIFGEMYVFAQAAYCWRPSFPFFVAAAVAGVSAVLGVALAKRDHRLALVALASACLFLATFLTRHVDQCVSYAECMARLARSGMAIRP